MPDLELWCMGAWMPSKSGTHKQEFTRSLGAQLARATPRLIDEVWQEEAHIPGPRFISASEFDDAPEVKVILRPLYRANRAAKLPELIDAFGRTICRSAESLRLRYGIPDYPSVGIEVLFKFGSGKRVSFAGEPIAPWISEFPPLPNRHMSGTGTA